MDDPGMDVLADLCRFLDDSPCPALAADALVARLTAGGFQALPEAGDWSLKTGDRAFVRRGSSVVAFIIRGRPKRYQGVGAHTDSPHLRLKPKAAFHNEGCRQLAVEVYGGVLWNSWLDRDLGLAGTLWSRDGQETRIRIDTPLARISQLAIHLDRKVNEDGLKLNPQLHLAAIWGLGGDAEAAFLELLARTSGMATADIVSHDLSLTELTPARVGGAAGELLFSGRLDNLASCHAGLLALLAAGSGREDSLPFLACFDHEEVGSASDTGAGGALLASTLERVATCLGSTRSQHLAALAASTLLSADMAHAVHPNYADRHEPRHKPLLGAGPVLKSNHNQRYATTGSSAALVRRLAKTADAPLQDFVSRSDLGCGSTIGPITAASLGMSVADLGAPMLSMHSARECAATADQAPFSRILTAHLTS